ncbi:XrtA/PEP-CTERM system histidine kinase PrsK [Duganella sp.]|uniref:XrtA/PEP-CTERM system histidine kinase PrsK n=1 Tax=Duganella sp. TaxID=1904440 RepID=UPI0031D6BE09
MQWDDAPAVAAFSHGTAALAFAALAAWLLRPGWRARPHALAMALAALLTALWAICALAAVRAGVTGSTWSAVALLELPEALRSLGWLSVLLALAGSRRFSPAIALLVFAPALPLLPALPPQLRAALPMALSVLGMLLVEHLYRSTPQNARWGVKFACLGIGALFTYDFYLYSDAMLFRRLSADIWAARGVVNALSAPLLALAMARGPSWTASVQFSRQMMFHSAALLGSALYLLTMAASAWYLRSVGGAWGGVMQMACLFGAVMILAALLFSGAMRARLKLFISKHFYKGRYDYREEWQRFTRALSDDGDGLSERAIQAVAALVESPAGMLWLRREDVYQPVGRWNMPLPAVEERSDGALCQLLATRSWVIELPHWPERPAWASDLWLVVPLMLERSLFGFIVLAPPRTALSMNWEVRDVLKIAGSQAASVIAHRASADGLAVARQFESFNRMSTFVVHDLKNLVSQLSLLLVNAEKHKSNPAFQQDMLDTLSHSLGKMKHMLLKLGRDQAPDSVARLQLDQLLARALQVHAGSEPRPVLELEAVGVTVLADGQRLERVIGHLVQNAVEATPRAGQVLVRLGTDEDCAVIEIRDTGHGMSEQFMRERLFQPFVSTKPAGMGIGVFESREYLREIGGQLQVSSAPSQGTIFRLTLPLHKESEHGQA